MVNSCLALYETVEEVRIQGGRAILPKTYESNLFHHNFIQFRKQDSSYKAILSPNLCHSNVVKHTLTLLQSKPVMTLDCQIFLKSSPLSLRAGSAPGLELIITDTSLTFHDL